MTAGAVALTWPRYIPAGLNGSEIFLSRLPAPPESPPQTDLSISRFHIRLDSLLTDAGLASQLIFLRKPLRRAGVIAGLVSQPSPCVGAEAGRQLQEWRRSFSPLHVMELGQLPRDNG
jgi:hypothetical protein